MMVEWYKKTIEETEKILGTSIKSGLDDSIVSQRLEEYGKNQMPEAKKDSFIKHFFSQFNDFMIITLVAAAAISFLLSFFHGESDFVDPIIILAIVIFNAVLGVVQENKAEKSLEALKKMAAPTTRVRRNGKVQYIPTESVIPGDIILLEAGDKVCADSRLIMSANLKIEESALTGESVPSEKNALSKITGNCSIGDRKNMAYTSSWVASGRAEAIVVETGINTEVGKIAKMIMSEDSPETPLQARLSNTGKMLGLGAIIICVLVFILGLGQVAPFEMFMTSVSLAVAAIPEGLPAIVTIMLSLGVTRMARKNAIIRKLPAVETLGSATVICSDKTGTLTKNIMKVVEISDYKGIIQYNSEVGSKILEYATLCNDSILSNEHDGYKAMGDPTETAVVMAAVNANMDKNILETEMPRVDEIPFESERKLMSTVHKSTNQFIAITKGASDVLINRCNFYMDKTEIKPLSPEVREKITSQNEKMADKALRVLGVAYKRYNKAPNTISSEEIENDLIFLGLIGMIDPPRDEVKHAVEVCKHAGIKPVMITGDHKRTAVAIAKKIGIMGEESLVMDGAELDRTSDTELIKVINKYSVFARVSPEHKVRIVKAFQANKEVVAMTGDGVNDAPALKISDIGCAMGINGTDVAKGAADMILTDDNFVTIVEAVKEGRGIYENIKKAVHFLLSSNIGEILTIFIAVLLKLPTPLLAIQLLWVNLVTDSLPAIALGVDEAAPDIMQKKPIQRSKSLFADGLAVTIFLEGCMIGLLALLAYTIGRSFYGENGITAARTMAFAVLSISQLVHAFNMRTEHSLLTINIMNNKWLVGAFFAGLALQVSVISIPVVAQIFKVVPLSLTQWGIVAGLSVVPIIVCELEKLLKNIIPGVKVTE